MRIPRPQAILVGRAGVPPGRRPGRAGPGLRRGTPGDDLHRVPRRVARTRFRHWEGDLSPLSGDHRRGDWQLKQDADLTTYFDDQYPTSVDASVLSLRSDIV